MNIIDLKLIAHRGLYCNKKDIPENSLLAFKIAIEKNYSIELDVRLTKDKKVVVFHDNNIKRLTGIDKNISDCTLEYINSLRLLNTNEKIPTLNEVLKLVNNSVPLLIELKKSSLSTQLEKEVLTILKTYNGRFALQSFNPFSIFYLRLKAKHIKRGQLVQKNVKSIKSKFLNTILSNMYLNIFTKPDFISYKIDDLDLDIANKIKKQGLYLISWTITNDVQLKKANSLCDGIIFENISPKNK